MGKLAVVFVILTRLRCRQPKICRSIPDRGKKFLSITKHPDKLWSPLVFHRLDEVLFWQQSGWSLKVTNHLHLLPPLRILYSVTHHGVYRGSLPSLLLLNSVWGLRTVVFRGWSFVKVKYGLQYFGVWQFDREFRLSVDYVSRAVSSFLLNTLHTREGGEEWSHEDVTNLCFITNNQL